MISASQNFVNAINGSTRRYSFMIKITRNDVGALPIDITDRVINYTTNMDYDARSGRIDIQFDNYDYLLSPLNRTSPYNLVGGVYNPLYDSNHKVELFEGVDIGNGQYEYVKKFEGYMGDEINGDSAPVLTISCRDKAKLLQETYIYQGPSYALFLVEQVIQDLLNTLAPQLNITLQVLNPTQYMIGRGDSPYTPSDTNLWDAIQLLADSASQELRFLEDGTLVMRKIIRNFSDATPILNLTLSNLSTNSISISDADVRNHIMVKVEGYNPIEVEDADSIAKYGKRYMEVQSGLSYIITDVSMAHELANNILHDLKYAIPNSTGEIAFHPLIQVADIITITNNRTGTDSVNDIFKVVSVQNTFSKDKRRTSLGLKAIDLFVSSQKIPSNAPILVSGNIVERIIGNYTGSGWNGYEKHTHFPKVTWNPPSTDISGNALETSFGGYVIFRRMGYPTPTTAWASVASVPSYIGSLGNTTYWYDYSAPLSQKKYFSGNTVVAQYKMVAVRSDGVRSSESITTQVTIPPDSYFDISGNAI